MRIALWLLALFGIAVAAALFAGNNPGSITLFWPPYRIDLSLNLFLVLLLVSFLTLHLAWRALSGQWPPATSDAFCRCGRPWSAGGRSRPCCTRFKYWICRFATESAGRG